MDFQPADVAVDTPSRTEVIGGGKVEVVGALRVGNLEIIAEGVKPLQRQPFPGAADVALEVIHRARRRRSAMGVRKECGVATRVVVVDSANIQAEVAKGLLVAAVEIHFEIAADIPCALIYVRVPVAEINAARMAVVEPALDRRLAEGLVDATEPVFRDEGHVSRNRRRYRRGGLLSAGNAGS